jgi:hypothetical protein
LFIECEDKKLFLSSGASKFLSGSRSLTLTQFDAIFQTKEYLALIWPVRAALALACRTDQGFHVIEIFFERAAACPCQAVFCLG